MSQHHDSPVRRGVTALGVASRALVAALAFAAGAAAQSGGVVMRPVAGQKVTSGINLAFDSRGVEGLGYRSLKFQLTFPQPLSADSEVRIVVSPYVQRYRYRPITQAEETFTAPAGARTFDAEMLVPLHDRLQSLEWEIWVDGRKATDICSGGAEYLPAPSLANEEYCSIVVLDDGAPSLAPLKAVMTARGLSTGTMAVSSGSQRATQLNAMTLSNVQVTPLADAAENWLAYSPVDLVLIDVDQLAKLAESRPAALAALRRWVGQGGNLCITSVGEDYAGRDQVDALFPSPAPNETMGRGAVASRQIGYAWRAPPPWRTSVTVRVGGRITYEIDPSQFRRPSIFLDQNAVFGPRFVGLGNSGGPPGGSGPYFYDTRSSQWIPPSGDLGADDDDADGASAEDAEADADSADAAADSSDDDVGDVDRAHAIWKRLAARTADASPIMTLRRWRFGTLVAYPTSLTPGTEIEWVHLLGHLGPERTNWVERHGVSFHTVNASFDDYGVPGVGMPPVNAFRVLITLFVLVIGPVNYFWLQRMHRRQLIILTVPIAAFGVTIALFSYSFIDDGVETRLSPVSLTFLDEGDSEATTWSLMAYYSGLAPRGGLSFSRDAAVYPIPREDAYARRGERARTVRWTDDRQALERGWISSRTPSELLTIRCTPTRARIGVAESTDGAAPPTVANELGTTIRRLFLIDSRGEIYTAGETASGTRTTLQAVDAATFSGELREIVFRRSGDAGMMGMGPQTSRNYYAYGDEYGVTIGDFHDSLMETLLTEAAVGGGEPLLGPCSYLAVVDQPPEFETGCAARIVEPFHVVMGSYAP